MPLIDTLQRGVLFTQFTLLDIASINSKEQNWNGDVRIEIILLADAGKLRESEAKGEFAEPTADGIFGKEILWPYVSNLSNASFKDLWISRIETPTPSRGKASSKSHPSIAASSGLVPVSFNMRLRGTFSQKFENLADFPVDSETLQIRLALQQDVSKWRFATREENHAVFATNASVSDVVPMGSVNVVAIDPSITAVLDEWRLARLFPTVASITHPARSRGGLRYSRLTALLLVKRRASSYILSLYLPFFLLSATFLLVFLTETHKVADRLTMGTGLVFTARSYLTSVGEVLPKRGGLLRTTLFERYVFWTCLFVLVGAAAASTVSFWPPLLYELCRLIAQAVLAFRVDIPLLSNASSELIASYSAVNLSDLRPKEDPAARAFVDSVNNVVGCLCFLVFAAMNAHFFVETLRLALMPCTPHAAGAAAGRRHSFIASTLEKKLLQLSAAPNTASTNGVAGSARRLGLFVGEDSGSPEESLGGATYCEPFPSFEIQ